jgi:hypothetical protein
MTKILLNDPGVKMHVPMDESPHVTAHSNSAGGE